MKKTFKAALGITSPWYVKTIDFDVSEKCLRIDVEAGSTVIDKIQMGALVSSMTVLKKVASFELF